VWVKFVEISFHDEFIDYSPCFLLPCSYRLDHCSYGLGSKERKRLMSQCFSYNSRLLCHGVSFTCRHDFQLDGFYPCFFYELLCWSTFFLLWNLSNEPSLFVGFLVLRGLLIYLYPIVLSHVYLHVPPFELWKLHRRLGHMSLDLLCRLSGLVLIRGLLKLTVEKNLTCFVKWPITIVKQHALVSQTNLRRPIGKPTEITQLPSARGSRQKLS
jgi:hypothetical protein